MKIHIRVKSTLLTVIIALIMATILSCQMIAPNFMNVINPADSTAGSNPSRSETTQTDSETNENSFPSSFYSTGDLTKTSGVNVSADDFIKGYGVNGVDIVFEEGSLDNGGILYDSLIVNSRLFGENFYTGGTLSELYFNQYTAQYSYTDDGKIKKIVSGNIELEYEYNSKGRLEKIYRNNTLYRQYIYGDDYTHDENVISGELWDVFGYAPKLAQGFFVAELRYPYSGKEAGGKVFSFSETNELDYYGDIYYNNNIFWPVDGFDCAKPYAAPQIDTADYIFGHNYSGNSYMTQRSVKGNDYDYTYSYEYINNKIVSETCFNRKSAKSYTLTYIFDSAFNRTGFYYNNELFYYAFDIFGNTEKIIDINGNPVVEYSYDLFGKCNVEGSRKDDIGQYNSYTYRALDDWYYDNILNYYYVGSNKIFDVNSGSFIKGNSDEFITADFKDFILDPLNKTLKNDEIENRKPLMKKSLLQETLIKEKIIEIAGQNLLEGEIKPYSKMLVWELNAASFDAESGIFTSSKAGERSSFGRADIYTAMDGTEKGEIFGGQVYVLGKSGDLSYAENKLYNLTSYNSYVYDGVDRYYSYAGEIAFEGHFIYLGKYVTYKSAANGIIEFTIKANKSGIYNENLGNLYNFATERYVLFYGSNIDFVGVEIVSNVKYVPDWEKIHQDMYDSLYKTEGLGCTVEATYTTYYSEAAALEMKNNTGGKITYFGGYDIDELRAEMGDDFMFTSKNGQTTVIETKPKDEFDIGEFLTDMAIGVGIIVITSTVIAMTGGSATPFVCFLVTSATLGSIALAGGAIAAGISMANGGSMNDALKGFSDGFMVTAAVASVVTAVSGTGACFAAGTKIETINGTKTIEKIKEGDLVLSYNEKTKKTEYQSVEKTFVRNSFEKITIKTAKDDIITTPEHPFYSDGRWIEAKDLNPGDKLLDANGRTVVVEQVLHEFLETPLTVYNFKVSRNHNYYVGSSGVLVHNADYLGAAAMKLPASISVAGGLTLSKTLLFAEIVTITLVVGGSMTVPQYSVPTTAEQSIRRAAAKPRTSGWKLLDYTANGGEMNMNTWFHIAFEINYKLEILFDPINYLQALAYLYLLGALDTAGKYTDAFMPYVSDPYVHADVLETLEKTKGKKNVHYGVYTECPSHALELAVATGCGPITPGPVYGPKNDTFYGPGEGTMTAYLVATYNFPGYFHLRGPNDAFRIWCMYPLFIRDNGVVWIDPRRDANGMLPKEDTYVYDPKYIWTDDYMIYQKWLYQEYEAEIFEWEWWSVF